MRENPCDLSLVEMRRLLREGELDPCELLEEALLRAEQKKNLNAFITINQKQARARAEESRQRLKSGTARALEGIPIAYKDMFCTQGIRTTAGSKILRNFVPPYSAHVVSLLEAAGVVSLGKCNQDEFAMGSASITSFQGAVINPLPHGRDNPLSAGGSSGGSAVAVAANIVPTALGTDTGGSVRQPAAFTGIVGVKPTYGRCSRFGIIAYASSLDQAGVFGRSVKDAALVLQAMMGFDKRDMTCANKPSPDLERACNNPNKPCRVGILIPPEFGKQRHWTVPLWEKRVMQLLEKLKTNDDSLEFKREHFPFIEQGALQAYYIIALAEASSNLARYDGMRYGRRAHIEEKEEGSLERIIQRSRSESFGAEVQRRILIGTHVLTSGYYDAVYVKAQKIRRLVYDQFQSLFKNYNILLAPVSPAPPFPLHLARTAYESGPLAIYLQDLFTVPPSLAGLPCLSLPIGEVRNPILSVAEKTIEQELPADKSISEHKRKMIVEGGQQRISETFPLPLQIIAKPFAEKTLFATAARFEHAMDRLASEEASS